MSKLCQKCTTTTFLTSMSFMFVYLQNLKFHEIRNCVYNWHFPWKDKDRINVNPSYCSMLNWTAPKNAFNSSGNFPVCRLWLNNQNCGCRCPSSNHCMWKCNPLSVFSNLEYSAFLLAMTPSSGMCLRKSNRSFILSETLGWVWWN